MYVCYLENDFDMVNIFHCLSQQIFFDHGCMKQKADKVQPSLLTKGI